jgi:hypothetical protein
MDKNTDSHRLTSSPSPQTSIITMVYIAAIRSNFTAVVLPAIGSLSTSPTSVSIKVASV